MNYSQKRTRHWAVTGFVGLSLLLSGCAGPLPGSPGGIDVPIPSTSQAESNSEQEAVFAGDCATVISVEELKEIFLLSLVAVDFGPTSAQSYPSAVQQIGGITCGWSTGTSADLPSAEIVVLPAAGRDESGSKPRCSEYDGPGLSCYFDSGDVAGYRLSGFIAGPAEYGQEKMETAFDQLAIAFAKNARKASPINPNIKPDGSWSGSIPCSDIERTADASSAVGNENLRVSEQELFNEGVAGYFAADDGVGIQVCVWSGETEEANLNSFSIRTYPGGAEASDQISALEESKQVRIDGVQNAFVVDFQGQPILEVFDGPNRLRLAGNGSSKVDSFFEVAARIVAALNKG